MEEALKALILMHAPYEGPGSFGEVLRESAASVTTVRLYETPDAPLVETGFDLILSMGGPQNADDVTTHPWLAREAEMLGRAARSGRKVLGICLGSQILARGLGATVRHGGNLEIGFSPIHLNDQGQGDAILVGLKETETVMHWHQNTFDLPEGAVLLASSAVTPHQAFRLGRHAYGLQFHLEITPELLTEWLENPAVHQQLLDHGGTAEEMLEQAKLHEKRLRWLCSSVLHRLLHLM